MFCVLIHVRGLNLHVGPRLGASLDISVDLSLNCWKLKRVKQIPRANQTDVMGGPYWPLVIFFSNHFFDRSDLHPRPKKSGH